MTITEFLSILNGEYKETAGTSAKNQCVDLANAYIKYVLNLSIIAGTNAVDFPSKAGNDYDYILNTPTGVPQEGDLVIWGGTYGHIAIFIEGDANRFTSFDENYPTGSPCHVQEHNYTSPKVLGWLHPKKTPPSDDTDPTEPIKTKDLQQLRYREEVLKDVCNYLEFDMGTVGSAMIITAFENLKKELLKSNKSLKEVEGKLTICLNQTPDPNPTDNPESIPDTNNNSGSAGTMEDSPNVPSGNTANPPAGADIAGFTIPQIHEAVCKVLHKIASIFHNSLKFFLRW